MKQKDKSVLMITISDIMAYAQCVFVFFNILYHYWKVIIVYQNQCKAIV